MRAEGVTNLDAKGDGVHFISNGKDQCVKLWDMRRSYSDAEGHEKASRRDVPRYHWCALSGLATEFCCAEVEVHGCATRIWIMFQLPAAMHGHPCRFRRLPPDPGLLHATAALSQCSVFAAEYRNPDNCPHVCRDYRWDEWPGDVDQVVHPHESSVMCYRGHSVMQTLIRAYFSPADTTGQRFVYAGSADGVVHVWGASPPESRIAYTRDPP